jgi:alpha-N-arabinofuranosidase
LLDFEPLQDGDEAGLTVFMNPRHHYEIAVSQVDGHRCVIVRRRIGSLAAVVARSPIDRGQVTLSIDAEPDGYRFWYALGHGTPTLIAEGETRYLSTEVAGGFTGVSFGLYASGSGRACLAPAYFEWFKYVPDPG